MQKQLFDRLIETSIAPIANWKLNGEILEVRVVRPDSSNPETERLQRGVKFDCHLHSPNIVQNLEYHGIVIPEDVRTDIIREIRGEELAKAPTDIDAKGTQFDSSLHAVDENGDPVLTKFKTFKRKA